MRTPHFTQPVNSTQKLEWALRQLQQSNVRLTRVREQVLTFLASRTIPPTLNEISGGAELAGQFDDATVYRTVVLLVELEVARQFQFRDRATCFLLNAPGERFSFLVCRCCGVITPVDHTEALCSLETQMTQQHGYTGLTHELELYGVCPACRDHAETCHKPSKFLRGLRLRGRANN